MNQTQIQHDAPAAGGMIRPPRVLGLGGTLRAGSTSELALRSALDAAAGRGAISEIITPPS
jgi:FMN reductase